MVQGVRLEPELLRQLRRSLASQGQSDRVLLPGEKQVLRDPGLIDAVVAAVQRRYAPDLPPGWDAPGAATELIYWETDWVASARDVFRRSVAIAAAQGVQGFLHAGEALVRLTEFGKSHGPLAETDGRSWMIADAPLFTDAMANADLLNR